METFKATTQYGDWTGTASADRSDATTLSDLLLQRGLRTEEEFLVGAKLWVGENHNNKLAHVFVHAYLFDGTGFDDVSAAIAEAGDALKLKRVSVELTLEEYICLFKRFAVALSDPHFDLEGREFSTD
ncbi:hypothetical protein [Burkholderia ubonensis]|uniref:hypothetical protein n=1 Tax=Burkholderia ubonensis TaxID=101571 RepID=UPI0008FE52DB|nr:hypothetical protein [Burkholderia ubonensis]OJA25436.1 hypothetical protein BGX87_24165 [Burkholderia ubonensis]